MADEEIELLKKRKEEEELKKAIAESEKAIAEANEAKLKASTPKGETKPLEGNITKDDKSGYISDLAAYHSIIKSTDIIADEINKILKGQQNILIVDSLDFCSNDVVLLQINHQINLYQDKMKKLNKDLENAIKSKEIEERGPKERAVAIIPPLLSALAVAPSILSIVGDTVGYLRADYDVKGREIKLSETAFVSALAKKINSNVYLMNFHQIKKSDVIELLGSCIKEHLDLITNISKAEKLAKAEELNQDNLEQIVRIRAESEVLFKEFDDFNKAITIIPEGKSSSLLANAVIRDYISKLNINYLFYASIPSAGGESITKKSIWSSGDTRFLGGGVVFYVLSDTDGKIIASNTIIKLASVKFNLGRDDPPEFRIKSD